MKLTRRKLAAAIVSAAALPSAAPEPAPSPQADAADDAKLARDRLNANAAALARVKLPMSTEPAFQFKA